MTAQQLTAQQTASLWADEHGILGFDQLLEVACAAARDMLDEVVDAGYEAGHNGCLLIALLTHPGEYVTIDRDDSTWTEHSSLAEANAYLEARAWTENDGPLSAYWTEHAARPDGR